MISAKNEILFESALYHDGKLWIASLRYNELYFYDIDSKRLKLVCKIEDNEEYSQRLVGDLVIVDKFLYLIPLSATALYQVDLNTFEKKKITIRKPDAEKYSEYVENVKFLSAHVYKDSIYMVGATYPAIVQYDCKKQQVHYHDMWLEEIQRYLFFDESALFRKTLMVGHYIYAPCCRGNVVLVFDLETHKYKIYEVGEQKCRFSGICYDGQNFWLSPRNDEPIVKWNQETNQYKEITINKNELNVKGYVFGNSLVLDNKIVLVPQNANEIALIDTQSEEIELADKEFMNSILICPKDESYETYCLSTIMQKVILFDEENNFEVCPICMPDDIVELHLKQDSYLHQFLQGTVQKQDLLLLYENYSDELNEYIQYCIKKEKSAVQESESMVGKDIYQTVT